MWPELYLQLYSPLLVQKGKNIKKENQTNNKSNDTKIDLTNNHNYTLNHKKT